MAISLFPKNGISSNRLILLTAAFFMLFTNFTFYSQVLKIYPLTAENFGFLMTLVLGFTGFIVVLLSLFSLRYILKPFILFLLLASSSAAYFMDSYQVMINEDMLTNALQTDAREVRDLLSLPLLGYVFVLGILPALWVAKVQINYQPWLRELFSRLKLLGGTLIVMAAMALAFSDYYGSFFREHKPLRYYFNPGGYLYGAFKYGKHHLSNDSNQPISTIGMDAHIEEGYPHRELIIVVVGETARADHFSLNGYERDTNPLLSKRRVISFTNFTSCGTSTAVSVPCMFSNLSTGNYDDGQAHHTENALDVHKHAGTNILWRDNNSSSKGVADRVEYQDYRDPKNNPICDEVECRDEGMLVGLQDYIDSHPEGDILIVLHQMGNHGPAYYKRYPKAFEKFEPTCHTNELKDCSIEEITNAYDNAILYTDYFLDKTIALLQKNDPHFETAMLYVSDHGESLGESGIYLHGMPNFIAPDAQRKVPTILWIGGNYDEVDFDEIASRRHQAYSHDNIFHTLLSFMEIESDVYDPKMDLLQKH